MAELAGSLASGLTTSPVQADGKHELNPRDRDSGVFLSDSEDILPLSKAEAFSLRHSPSTKSTSAPQRSDSNARRLRRPAELNLGKNTANDGAKPKSELELRYDLIRNSKTQSKAALRSPNSLLRDRLNLSPKAEKHEEKIRTFTPPKPMLNGCILPGPSVQMDAFTGSSVRARTEKGGRPAWWCKFDKLVVFDNIETLENGELKINTRTSKGLTIARRRGELETVIIPMNCQHCQEMLNRQEWKYDIQVCKRSVCWDCKERCKWEQEDEKKRNESPEDTREERLDTNRLRADSVLQDEQSGEEALMMKAGIEQGPKSPVEAVGGIEERLERSDGMNR